MNQYETEEMERMLARLSLRTPSPAMDRRVRRPRFAAVRILAFVGAAAAAAALVLLAMHGGLGPRPGHDGGDMQVAASSAAPAPRFDFDPVRVDREVSEISYQGLESAADGSPVRKYQERQYEQLLLVDQQRGISIELTRPTLEATVLVSAQTY